jgi:hypothetical protein
MLTPQAIYPPRGTVHGVGGFAIPAREWVLLVRHATNGVPKTTVMYSHPVTTTHLATQKCSRYTKHTWEHDSRHP